MIGSPKVTKRSKVQLLFVSDQLPYKHHVELIKAVGRLNGEEAGVELTMVGRTTGPYSRLVNEARIAVDPNCDFIHDLGFRSREELKEIYTKADSFFAYPSSCENMPFIVLEAMSLGLPIVSSKERPYAGNTR